MGWETPPAEVARNAVGKLCPAHSRRNKDLHSTHLPARTRIAVDRNRDGCSVVHSTANALVTLFLVTVAMVRTLSKRLSTRSPYNRHSSIRQWRWCWRLSSSRGQSTPSQPDILRPCSHSRRRRRRRSDIERSTQTQSGIRKSPRCCRTDKSK